MVRLYQQPDKIERRHDAMLAELGANMDTEILKDFAAALAALPDKMTCNKAIGLALRLSKEIRRHDR